MAKIPLPERGQPLDLTYRNSLADAVNTLYNQVSVSTSNYASIDTTSQDKINLKTSEIGLVAGRVEVYNNATVTVAQEKDFSYIDSDIINLLEQETTWAGEPTNFRGEKLIKLLSIDNTYTNIMRNILETSSEEIKKFYLNV